MFVLECAVRTGGFYSFDFEPTRELEPLVADRLDAGIEEVYGYSPARRVEAAFELPYGPLAKQAPEWPRVGCVEPRWDSVPALPSLVDTLAPIRAVDPPRVAGARAAGRVAVLTAAAKANGGGASRSVSRVVGGETRYADLSDLDADDGVETVSRRRTWVGRDVPLGANHHLQVAARNRHEAELEPTEPPIQVAVVSNEARMDPELEAVRSLYGGRSDLAVDVDVHRRLDRRSFRALLESDVDFLHYVGHATPDGLDCPDGRMLDVVTVAETGVTAFCLNACQSYTQGRRLIEAGALGGIVTHGDVGDEMAHRIGATLARLLNNGYSLAATLDVAGTVHPVGSQYCVLGEVNKSIAQGASAAPCLWKLTPNRDSYNVRIDSYAARSLHHDAGSFVQYNIDDDNLNHLRPGTVGPFETSVQELREVLESPLPPPFLLGEKLYWGSRAIERIT